MSETKHYKTSCRSGSKHLPVLTMLAIALLFAQSNGQQNIDYVATQDLLRQRGFKDDSQIQNALRKYQENSKPVGTRDTGIIQADTALHEQKDTSGESAVKELSTYEKITRNILIDPDTILKTIPIFGHDVFKNTKSAMFTPDNYIATPADYPIGPGDEINIMLWGRLSGNYSLKVDREGRITLPHGGEPIMIAGKPFSKAKNDILEKVKKIEGVSADVTMGELRSIGVFVVGEAQVPGMYTISSLSNITNAIFAAGGPNKQGSLRTILLKRNGNLIATIDFYDFLLSGKDKANVRLQPGDVIVIPIVKKMAAIAGNVRRSALYEIKEGTTLKDLITLAGGMTPAAWTNRIQIERFSENQYQVVVDREADTNASQLNYEIQDGDIVKIFPIVIKNKNAVYLSGNIYRPGKYEFREGMKITDLLPTYEALLPETYFDYAVIVRQDPPNFLGRIIPFDLKKAMENPASPENLTLQARDAVVVHSRDYFEPDRTVFIGGAVTNTGRQKLMENMKIRDLIIKAGGLLEEASEERGELYRRTIVNEIVSMNKIEFHVRHALENDVQQNMELKKFDIVIIRTKNGWEKEKHVILKGEFVYPGDYVLLEKETLGEIIQRAGGFTTNAYRPAAILTRVSAKDLEQKRLNEYVNRLELDAVKTSTELMAKQQASDIQSLLQQQQLLLNKLRQTDVTGRVVIDLENDSASNRFLLQNGDSLYVPRKEGTVSVIGEVYNPATFKFDSTSVKVKYYLEMAGGLKETADAKNIYIFRANGSVLTKRVVDIMDYGLSPADVVVVPQKVIFKNNFKIFMDALDSIVKISGLLLSVATVLILLNQNK